MTENGLMVKILREIRNELRGHGEQLKSIKTELVNMRRDGMKRDTHALEVDTRVDQLEGRVSRLEKRK